ncbi:hypothetical protein J2X72_004880 [Phyllobacterium sp. 1468]|nr:hypothetical protein [Phyllobacterium sp. 1468]
MANAHRLCTAGDTRPIFLVFCEVFLCPHYAHLLSDTPLTLAT